MQQHMSARSRQYFGKHLTHTHMSCRYLAQALQHATQSVYEEVRSAMTHLIKIEERMNEAEEAMLKGKSVVQACVHVFKHA